MERSDRRVSRRFARLDAFVRACLAVALLSGVIFGSRPVGAEPDLAMPMLELADRSGQAIRISRLIMGTDHLGQLPSRAQAIEVLDEAVRLGINAFDTAPIYDGYIEQTFATWLASKQRSDLHVITKGGFPRDLGPGTYDSRLKGSQAAIAANVREELEGSRSKYDRVISVYLMHRDDADFAAYARIVRDQTPALTILEALTSPLLRRHYRMLGLSNWTEARIIEARAAALRHPGLVQPVCSSPYFSLLEMSGTTIHSGGVQVTHADMLKPGFLPGVRLMTYSPLGGFSIVTPGWEQARERALSLKKANDRYWGRVHDAIFHDANAARYARAEAFMKRFNAAHGSAYTLDQVLHAYVLAHPRTDYVVIGPRDVGALRRTVRALELSRLLTPRDLEELHGDAKGQWPARQSLAASRGWPG